jgi:hypothetical protein
MPMESTAGSGRGLGHAVDKSTSVGADSDVYFAVHVDTERRSVNDARCRCQGVSDLPAMVRATRCAGDDLVVDFSVVDIHRRSGRPCDAVCRSVVLCSAGWSGAAG